MQDGQEFYLLGLPGAGKTQLATDLRQQLEGLSIRVHDQADTLDLPGTLAGLTLCVVDVRSPWPVNLQGTDVERALLANLARANAVVLTFLATSDLTTQLHWQAELSSRLKALHRVGLPILRCMKTSLSAEQLDKLRQLPHNISVLNAPAFKPDWQALFFKVNTLDLNSLMMGLEGLRHSGLGLIWRISGSFLTPEYAHPVCLEFTPLRLDIFPAENSTGILRVLVNTENSPVLQPLLQQLIDACSVSS